MATAQFKEGVLRLVYENGFNEAGKLMTRAKTYRNVQENATANQLYQVANVLSSFTASNLIEVYNNEQSLIN